MVRPGRFHDVEVQGAARNFSQLVKFGDDRKPDRVAQRGHDLGQVERRDFRLEQVRHNMLSIEFEGHRTMRLSSYSSMIVEP